MFTQLQQFITYQESWASWYRYILALALMEKQHQLSKRRLRILDIGGGNGIITEELLKQNQHVTLIDSSKDMIRAARERLGTTFVDQVSFEVCNVEKELPVPPEHFDLVVVHHIIEYLADPQAVLAKLAQCVKPIGELSLVTLNPVSEVLRRIHFDASPVEAYHKLQDLRYDAQWFGAAQLYKDQHLDQMLNAAGWKVIDKRGMRVFSDYLKEDLNKDETFREDLVRLELEVSSLYPYSGIARYRMWACQKCSDL